MTCPILTAASFRKELARTLTEVADTAAKLRLLFVMADAKRAPDLPSTAEFSAREFAFEALDRLLREDREDLLPVLVREHPVAHDQVLRILRVREFLVALRKLAGLDRHARTIAAHLAQAMPFADEALQRLQPGTDLVANLAPLLLERCLRSDVDVKITLIRLGRVIISEYARASLAADALAGWLHAETGVATYVVAPAQRVLSIRLLPHAEGGWWIAWACGVTPGQEANECPIADRRVHDIDDLWRVLRPAAAHLVDKQFVEHPRDLIVSVQVAACDALRRFHGANDERAGVAWRYFRAVTLWPWFVIPDDVIGFRYDGEIHRPTAGAPSATLALHDRDIGLAAVRDSIDRHVVLLCTEPVWHRAADGLSAGVDTHEGRTASVLLAGEEVEAFLDLLFAQDSTRPVHDLFRAAREWLAGERDLYFLWTDPDYKPKFPTLKALP